MASPSNWSRTSVVIQSQTRCQLCLLQSLTLITSLNKWKINSTLTAMRGWPSISISSPLHALKLSCFFFFFFAKRCLLIYVHIELTDEWPCVRVNHQRLIKQIQRCLSTLVSDRNRLFESHFCTSPASSAWMKHDLNAKSRLTHSEALRTFFLHN